MAGKRCQRQGCTHRKCECCFFLGRAFGIEERKEQVREAKEVVEGLKVEREKEREKRETEMEGVVGELGGLGLGGVGEGPAVGGEGMDESSG